MACQAALALLIYFTGTSIRSGLNWGQYIAANRNIDAPTFEDVYLVVALAVKLSVIGAGFCIYSFALVKHRAAATLTAVVVALLVPACVYWLDNPRLRSGPRITPGPIHHDRSTSDLSGDSLLIYAP
jgi:hypothetical protein